MFNLKLIFLNKLIIKNEIGTFLHQPGELFPILYFIFLINEEKEFRKNITNINKYINAPYR